jgi:hypothetical protein
MTLDRRNFLKHAGVVSLAGLGATLAHVADVHAADYKALVVVFLSGGHDGNNLLVPMDGAYNDYAKARPSLALPKDSLVPLQGSHIGHKFGLSGASRDLRTLFEQQKLAIVANVGALVQPTTLAQVRNNTAKLPPFLGSHTEQEQWKESINYTGYYISNQGNLFSYKKQHLFIKKKVCLIRGKEVTIKNEVYKTFKGDIPKGYVVTEDYQLKEVSTKRRKKINSIYRAMKSRCHNENSPDYKRYGGRGIIIEESFDTFDKFFDWSINNKFELDKKLSIDRIDNNGNYSADNCAWIPIRENVRKTRRTILNKEIVFEIRYGTYKDKTSAEIAKILNCSAGVIRNVRSGKTWKDC